MPAFPEAKRLANCFLYATSSSLIPNKIHKHHRVGRPIVSSVNSLTANASIFLDHKLQPLLASHIPAYLRDSTTILHDLLDTTLPSNVALITCHVVSLYPSIPLKEGLQAVAIFLRKYLPLEADFLISHLDFVLHNNYFFYGDVPPN